MFGGIMDWTIMIMDYYELQFVCESILAKPLHLHIGHVVLGMIIKPNQVSAKAACKILAGVS